MQLSQSSSVVATPNNFSPFTLNVPDIWYASEDAPSVSTITENGLLTA